MPRPVSREQVERMKGVWIFDDDWWEFQCSKCHKGIGNIGKYKFCPYCGQPIDGTQALTHEEAETALKGENHEANPV